MSTVAMQTSSLGQDAIGADNGAAAFLLKIGQHLCASNERQPDCRSRPLQSLVIAVAVHSVARIEMLTRRPKSHDEAVRLLNIGLRVLDRLRAKYAKREPSGPTLADILREDSEPHADD